MSERKGTKGLELWCRKMTEGYPGVKIDNMTTSWRDGLAFCAIIHHFRPDLIEFNSLNKDNIYHNNELAFRVAEHHLGIPALLEPEDMVEYEVPDRLSILTYLSQFYQTFESQRGKSGARIAPKRPQSTPDHGIVSPASTSPPTKVQVTIGRARREPCAKCGFPVFIAERLNVGKLLYHRTCFRCARCSSQLTLANYYETENGEFCCEICPDEEKQISKKISPDSVLTRSLSDEEKTASLQTYSDAPDAYSTHFETALEFSLDRDLKKNSTLTEAESTEFTKARSHFFKSQIESVNDSGGEDIPVELPKSKPPPLIKSQYEAEPIPINQKPVLLEKPVNLRTHSVTNSDSSFPSDNKDTAILSSSVSEQTNDRFVTKDNASSSNRISVRARMKLFENNEDNKSDVNMFFGSNNNQVPSSSSIKKKATVVAINDLEDFDNISKKDSSSEKSDSNIKLDSVKETTVHSNENEISTKMQQKDQTSSENVIEILNSSEEAESIVEILDTTQDPDKSHISIVDSEKKDNKTEQKSDISCISIDDSPAVSGEERQSEEEQISNIAISEDSFLSANNVVSPASISSDDASMPKRGYYTAYQVLSPEDDSPKIANDVLVEDTDDKKCNNVLESKSESVEANLDHSVENKENDNKSAAEEIENIKNDNKSVIQEIELITKSESNEDIVKKPLSDKKFTPEGELDIEPKNQQDDFNPFSDDDHSASTSRKSFRVLDEDEVIVSTKPVPAARPKKKIIPSLAERELTGTPEHLSRIYAQRISNNPFEDEEDEDEEAVEKPSYNPFDDDEKEEEEVAIRPKKKLIIGDERKMLEIAHDWSAMSTDSPNNPFDDDDDDDEEIEAPVKPVPVPTPRISKALRPEPKPRDTLSITSRGSHGGSNSSISSGSAFGSARKKKPAPRPPIPFTNSPHSSLTSPSSSVAQSPNLSGTMRSRKTKRAPLPPNVSTPSDQERKDTNDRIPTSLEISPLTTEEKEVLSDDIHKEKNVKDEENRSRQSQIQSVCSESDNNLAGDKSTAGRWKRRKGQAPSRPIPQRRIVKSLPISEIKRELDTIEIQQQGLEKQGVRLEQIIREKCEGTEGTRSVEDQVPIEVEDLILQLFELVNEKNELFRRQAELMYLRRQQRLEEEYADVEYQIRCLISQPEANKSDSDKVREETLINRLVEIVERRNEIIECLEMDRRREAEEDNSISSQLNLYSAKRDSDKNALKEGEKKDKKKKHKKLNKIIHTFKHKKEKDHKVDVDKDVDESELNSSSEKGKKKKFNLF